jgi:hypothetical protein
VLQITALRAPPVSLCEVLAGQFYSKTLFKTVRSWINNCDPDQQWNTVGVFVYWYAPVRTGTKSIRLVVLLGSKIGSVWNYPTVGPQSGAEPFVYSWPFQYRSGPVLTNKRILLVPEQSAPTNEHTRYVPAL